MKSFQCNCGNEGTLAKAFRLIHIPAASPYIKKPSEFCTGGTIHWVDLYACRSCGTVKSVERPACPKSGNALYWNGDRAEWVPSGQCALLPGELDADGRNAEVDNE